MVAIIYSTIDDIKNARRIAHTLVEEQLVACVNIIPNIESIYKWKGKIEMDNECALIAADGDVVNGTGALVGKSIGANPGQLIVDKSADDLLTGKARCVVEFVYDK